MSKKQHILFVDDEAHVLEAMARVLHGQRNRWELSFAQSADEALERVSNTPFDAIVSDVEMPGKTGLDMLEELRASYTTADIPVIILTGLRDDDLKRRALDRGATDLLNKPVSDQDLIARLQNVLRLKSYQDELKASNDMLEDKVRQRTAELEQSRLDIIWRLAKAGEFRDQETGSHMLRVGCYCRLLAEKLAKPREFVETISLASLVHDIGKIGIADAILRKPGKLTNEEQAIMRQHCIIGADILNDHPRNLQLFLKWRANDAAAKLLPRVTNPFLEMASTIALTHHEKWDGTGYPSSLRGDNIPQESRITAIADVYDALGSARPYKPALSQDHVLTIMREGNGTFFDPQVYAAFEDVRDQFKAIRVELADDTARAAS